MDQYSLLFNVIILAAGAYLLYTWFRLKKEGQLFESQLLIPKDFKPSDCIDPEEYIAYFQPRILVLGIVCFLTGALCALEVQFHLFDSLFPSVEKLSYYMDLGGNAISLLVLVWYTVCWSKARKKYW